MANFLKRLLSGHKTHPDPQAPAAQRAAHTQGQLDDLAAAVNSVFGLDAVISDHRITDDGQIGSFTVHFDTPAAIHMAQHFRRRRAERMIAEILGDRDTEWDLAGHAMTSSQPGATATFTLPVHVSNPGFTPAGRHHNGRWEVPCGVDAFGDPVTWHNHVDIVGRPDDGTDSLLRTILLTSAQAGASIVFADFAQEGHRAIQSPEAFQDWPNVHLHTIDTYSGLRAITYVHDLMTQRMADAQQRTSPIVLAINELDRYYEIVDRTIAPRMPDVHDKFPTHEMLRGIRTLGRSLGVHLVTASPRRVIDFHRDFRGFTIQVGNCSGPQSQLLWDDFEVGQTVPPGVPGRALAYGEEGFIQFQCYDTPDPTGTIDDDARDTLAALRPARSLYPHVHVKRAAGGEISSWHQIATAPIVPIDTDPDPPQNTAQFVGI
ncbi:cell division protein FtsK [Mycobacteroides abscessus subsp. bolletii]|uniref:hypothetical protein n=1 Tax=Mycobacteroides abscessus TaxID=36809 RepID=UPI0009A6D81F|nr:hypothetical protein [Mycobacteroides abscessus]SKZ02786.1 cell division protein FtsK [Mycobacteroides abscessus subsp. bolletii]